MDWMAFNVQIVLDKYIDTSSAFELAQKSTFSLKTSDQVVDNETLFFFQFFNFCKIFPRAKNFEVEISEARV